jgi:[acyl-carrier-protein] S-malonyltransferase
VENVLVIAAPGQGAQTPGFLQPWLELPGVADRLGWWSDVVGMDLIRYGTTADAEEIRDTAVAQPLLVSAALAAFEELDVNGSFIAAGHSVGELAAAAMAGALSPEAALVFVRERGRGMAEAATATATGMTAVLGGDPGEVLSAIADCGLTPANVNAVGQVVAAGTKEQLELFAERPPAKARLRSLSVAGAFHTHHMAPAADRLTSLARGIRPADPATTLISNADGAVVTSGADLLRRLVAQVSTPVRWDLCLETMAANGATALIELPPGGTLTGIARRALPGVERVALNTPDDLDAAKALVNASYREDAQ